MLHPMVAFLYLKNGVVAFCIKTQHSTQSHITVLMYSGLFFCYTIDMKNKPTILIVLLLVLAGCNVPNKPSSTSNEHTLVLDYGFVFNHVQNQKGEQLAKLLLNDSYYSFPSEINIEEPIVAGDQLSITFDGEYDGVCLETYPAQCTITGTIKSYHLIQTEVIGLLVDGASMAVAIRNSGYVLDNEYVILDEEGRYTSLDEYDDSNIYLSVNQKKMEEYCTCPEGAQCGPCPIYISQLYAYNPRQ